MHVEHEFVEMGALLALDLNGVEEQVHQHRLAPADTAPHVEAAWWLRRLSQQFPQGRPARRSRFQFLLKRVQPCCGGLLVRIRAQFPGRDEHAITLDHAAHLGTGTLRTVAVEEATSASS